MKVKIRGTYIDPYTWDVISFSIVINIDSVKSARKWARNHYFKCVVNQVEKED